MAIDVFAPAKLGPITLRNRVIKAATFEGCTPQGKVTDRLIDFHRAVGAGGAAMTTVAYLAVSPRGPDGQTLPDVAGRHDARAAPIDRHRARTRCRGGRPTRSCRPGGQSQVQRRPRPRSVEGISPMGTVMRAVSEQDITRITTAYAEAAVRAKECGFDALELHLGHNYLLSAFLSPKLNRRKDGFGGGSRTGRGSPDQVVTAVRQAVGDSVAVTAKLNMADGVAGGLWVDESVEVAQIFEEDGTSTRWSSREEVPWPTRCTCSAGTAPLREFGATLPGPVQSGSAVVGHRFINSYPYEEASSCPSPARSERPHLTLILLGGITGWAPSEVGTGRGVRLRGHGPGLLREPDLVNKMAAGTRDASLCVHCNKCMPTIYSRHPLRPRRLRWGRRTGGWLTPSCRPAAGRAGRTSGSCPTAYAAGRRPPGSPRAISGGPGPPSPGGRRRSSGIGRRCPALHPEEGAPVLAHALVGCGDHRHLGHAVDLGQRSAPPRPR